MKTNKPSLKGSLSSDLGALKKIKKQEIDIPIIKDTVTELHKKSDSPSVETETKGVLVKIDKDLHKKIKGYCVLKDIDMQEYFREAVNFKAQKDNII